jgi:hypothetical protein
VPILKGIKMSDMLQPSTYRCEAVDCDLLHMEWLKGLGKSTYCFLFQCLPEDLPLGYDLYVITFAEWIDEHWLIQQYNRLGAPIIVLSDAEIYNTPFPDGIQFKKYYYLHTQFDLIQTWFPNKVNKNLQYKYSVVCHRISQAKVWITTALLETAKEHTLCKLSDWLEEKNVHNWQDTSNSTLNNLTKTFKDKWLGVKIDLEDTSSFVNNQKYTSDPWNSLYQNCALHFTNESDHFSYTHNHLGQYIRPGPFLTEKTFKCLLGGTGFIPIGKHNTYGLLRDIGFKFNYDFDISWDNEPQDLLRFESIVKLISDLNKMSAQEIFDCTKHSSEFNQDYIYSGDFYKFCETQNQKVINDLT